MATMRFRGKKSLNCEQDNKPTTITACCSRWTGSNTNPNNNDGQGRRGTDRHNAVMLHEPRYPERPAQDPLLREQVFGKWGLSYPQHLDNTTFLGLSREDTDSLALLTSSKYAFDYNL